MMKLLFVAFLLSAGAAVGQEVTVVAPAAPTIWEQIRDPLYTFIVGLIPIVIGVIGVYARQYLGERAAKLLQDMLQAAAERAAAKALNTGGPPTEIGTRPSNDAVLIGVRYIKETMPDTVKKLGLDDTTLASIVSANMGKLKLASPAPVAETPPKGDT